MLVYLNRHPPRNRNTLGCPSCTWGTVDGPTATDRCSSCETRVCEGRTNEGIQFHLPRGELTWTGRSLIGLNNGGCHLDNTHLQGRTRTRSPTRYCSMQMGQHSFCNSWKWQRDCNSREQQLRFNLSSSTHLIFCSHSLCGDLSDDPLRYVTHAPLQIIVNAEEDERKIWGLDEIRNNSPFTTHRLLIFGLQVTEPLHVVEDQPDQGDDHQDDEGYWDKQHGSPAIEESGLRIDCRRRDSRSTHRFMVCICFVIVSPGVIVVFTS